MQKKQQLQKSFTKGAKFIETTINKHLWENYAEGKDAYMYHGICSGKSSQ
jgi:hypothetical protein